MATKDDCLSFKGKQADFAGDPSNGRYSNLNLNQNNKCSNLVPVTSKSVTNDNEKFSTYDFSDKNNSQAKNYFDWKESSKNLPPNLLNANNSDKKGKIQNCKNTTNAQNNSTLSLHITAYENSVKATSDSSGKVKVMKVDKSSLKKKWKTTKQLLSDSKSAIQNAYEFPRQQRNIEPPEPEIAQFKASQKLLNPNKSVSSSVNISETASEAVCPSVVNQNDLQNSEVEVVACDSGTGPSYSIEELHLLAIKYIHENLTVKELFQHLEKIGEIGERNCQYVKEVFEAELCKFVKSEIKNAMTELVSKGNTKFIEEAKTNFTLKSEFFSAWTKKLIDNGILLTDERIIAWINELKRFYELLESRFISIEAEDIVISLTVEWFESGEMSPENWMKWDKWFPPLSKDINLQSLKSIQWAASHNKIKPKFLRALQTMTTDNFLKRTELHDRLKLYLGEPSVEIDDTETTTVNVIGKTIFLSKVKAEIQSLMRSNGKKIEQIDIIAINTLYIDVDLDDNEWKGLNITVDADKVNVWGEHVIDVSGKGFVSSAEARTAQDGRDGKDRTDGKKEGEDGRDGKDGKAGESGGNILIITEQIINRENLTLNVNGGNGEDGESGGRGGDGINGKRVTKDELDNMAKYLDNFIYIGSNPSPPGWFKKFGDESVFRSYIFYKFYDSDGRKLYYTYGAHRGWFYNWVELVVRMKGTDGTAGGKGGQNGKGGEGGKSGDCVIVNHSNETPFSIRTFQSNGENGKDGEVGECGTPGKNGNHMAFINRKGPFTGSDNNERYYGSNGDKRLKLQWKTKYNTYTRINQYKNSVKSDPACHGEFDDYSVPIISVESKHQKKEERSNEAKATMKKSIVMNKILQKAQKHKAKMNTALNFTASNTATFTKRSYIDEEAEEEESKKQEQQVAVVKDINEAELDNIFGSKARKRQLSQEEFREKIMQAENSEVLWDIVENIIDYFSIEFDNEILEALNTEMLRNFGIFQECMKSPKDSISIQSIIEALQANKSDQWTLSKLQQFANELSTKQLTKALITKLRSNEFSSFVHSTKLPIIETLVPTEKEKLERVKFLPPKENEWWHPNVPQTSIDDFINSFFINYSSDDVNLDLLSSIFEAFTALNSGYSESFKCFKTVNIKWHDIESWEQFQQALTESDINVQRVIQQISADKNWFIQNFKALQMAISGSGVWKKLKDKAKTNKLAYRFGKVPVFHKTAEENLEAAQYLFRFYWQMKALIEFYRRFMIINLLHDGEDKNINKKIMKSYAKLEFKDLIKRIKAKKIQLEADECRVNMKEKGFKSLAFRFLASDMHQLNIEIYGNEKYGTIEMLESCHGDDVKLIRLYFDGEQFFDIVPDLEMRYLFEARKTTKWDTVFEENQKCLDQLPWDYCNAEDKAKFAGYFLPSFSKTIYEWIDCYLAATNYKNQNLIKMLHQRFECDGNHLEIADFQFLLSTSILLQNSFQVSSDFIVKFASSIPQSELVDQFFILRLESIWRRQLSTTPNLLNALKLIRCNKLKILLATKIEAKLDENDEKENEKILYKILLMLRHTSTTNSQLEKSSIDAWKLYAEKQKCFEISDAVKNLGNLGYYIIFLKQKGETEKADELELFLTKPEKHYYIPQKLIAQICSLIVYDEIVFDAAYLSQLDNLLTLISSKLQKTDKHVFITNECEQAEMLRGVKDTPAYKYLLATEKIRDLNVIASQTKDIHNKNDKETSKRIASLILNPSNSATKILNKYNECIRRRRGGKSLRDTQKMAIMYAVECERNLLEQVNTGEGKSLIVVGIAIIQASKFKNINIFTSSPPLAKRDAAEMKDLFEDMGFSVDHNCHDDMEKRKLAYKAKIVYGEISHFQRDYLLQSYCQKNIIGDRKVEESCAILDEVDNMLCDNGNNVLYLSHTVRGMHFLEPLFVHLFRIIAAPTTNDGDKEKAFATETIEAAVLSDLLGRLSKSDIEMLANDPKSKAACFTIWEKLVDQRIIDSEGYLLIQDSTQLKIKQNQILTSLLEVTNQFHANNIFTCLKVIINRSREISIPRYRIPFVRRHLKEYIENAKLALFMKPNDSYVVDTDRTGQDSDITPKITIMDKNTGVDLSTSQWSGGLHQGVQIKHGCRVSPASMKAFLISIINYSKMHAKLIGLTGTMGSIEENAILAELYRAKLITIPTFCVKRFYEHVPVIVKTDKEWLDSIFDEIINQVEAGRSVLIISDSIVETETIENGLKERFSALADPSEKVKECYNTLITYQRQHDEFEFNAENALEPSSLLISTNLAGRGTDIKLDQKLRDSGGLHVIVSFLPENSRIEEQAFGRAARCGEPGSAGIIAKCDGKDSNGKIPSIFDLKMFRDNAEIQRTKSMKDQYEFYTKVIEDCLAAFKEHSLKALQNVKPSGNDGIPSEEEVIYFALIDEWSLWLDSQEAAIKQCLEDRCPLQRDNIIKSVKEFLKAHPISSTKWIKCPLALLDLGLVRIDRDNLIAAEAIFDRIIVEFPDFAGHASYYKGVISQRNVRKVKTIPKIDTDKSGWLKKTVNKVTGTINEISPSFLTPIRDVLPEEICEIDEGMKKKTEDYFLQGIGSFNHQSELKKESHTIISKLHEAVGSQIVKSSGFKNQCDDTVKVYDSLSTSAYDLIGHPISYATFAEDAQTIESKYKGFQRFRCYQKDGYVTERSLNNKISDFQYEIIKNKHSLPKEKVQKAFKNISDRQFVCESDVKEAFKMPSREDFWGFLDTFGFFKEKKEFYVLQTSAIDGEINELAKLKPIQLSINEPMSLQLSGIDLSTKILYDVAEIENIYYQNDELKEKLKWLDSMEYLVKDAMAVVDFERFSTFQMAFPNYDYFLLEDLADWLGINNDEAKWIASKLTRNETVKYKETKLTKINDKALNLSHEILEKYGSLLESKDLKKLNDFSLDVAKVVFEKSENPEELFQEMLDHKIIVPYEEYIFTQNIDYLQCPYLPECIRNSVEAFLRYKFSYTFVYEALQEALKKPTDKKPLSIMPWKPHQNLFKDFIKYGLIHDHRLDVREKQLLDEEHQKEVEKVEKKVASRLFIKSGTLLSTKKFFKDEHVEAGMDVQMQTINSMKQVGKIGENYWWIFWLIVKAAFAIFMAWSAPGMILMALDIIMNFDKYWGTALTVIAAVGTMLYFTQIMKAKYVTQTGKEAPQEKYTQLLDFHHNTVKRADKHKVEVKLANAITTSITSAVKNVIQFEYDSLCAPLMKELKKTKMSERKFNDISIEVLNQPYNWRILNSAIRDVLNGIYIKVAAEYFNVLNNCKTDDGIVDNEKAMIACQKLNENLVIKITEANKKLLKSLTEKIIEDCVIALQESKETGKNSEEDEGEIPQEFREAGSDLDDLYGALNEEYGNSDDEESEDESITSKNEFVKEFANQIENMFYKELQIQITNPLTNLFSNFIQRSNSDSDTPEGLKEYRQENSENKLSMEMKKKQVVACQAMSFIVLDLQKVVRQSYQDSPSMKLLYKMIQHGHALSPIMMEDICGPLYQIFKNYNPHMKALKVVVDGKSLVFPSSFAGADKICTITIILNHEQHFYICQNDSRRLFKNKKDGDYMEACLFESISKHNYEAIKISKQGAEAFRNLLLQQLSGLKEDASGKPSTILSSSPSFMQISSEMSSTNEEYSSMIELEMPTTADERPKQIKKKSIKKNSQHYEFYNSRSFK